MAQAPEDLVALIRAERGRLVAAMALLVDDRGVAEEIVQEAFVRAASRWESVRRLESPGGWTYRVARNLAQSRLRRRAAERRALIRLGPPAEVHHDPDLDHTLHEALSRLPVRQREAVLLRHYLGYDTTTTAELMGVTVMAVRKLVQRGVAELRNELGIEVADLRQEEASDAV